MSDKPKQATDTEVRRLRKELQDLHKEISLSDSEDQSADAAFHNYGFWRGRAKARRQKALKRIAELEEQLRGK